MESNSSEQEKMERFAQCSEHPLKPSACAVTFDSILVFVVSCLLLSAFVLGLWLCIKM